jgi:hypothetical protein
MRSFAIVGLVVGFVGVTLVPVLSATAIETSLCELERNPTEYYGKSVQVTGEYATDGGYYWYLWDSDCSASVSIRPTPPYRIEFSGDIFDGSTAFVEDYILRGSGLFNDSLAKVTATFSGEFRNTDFRGHAGDPLGPIIFVESVSTITMEVNCEIIRRSPEMDAPQCR